METNAMKGKTLWHVKVGKAVRERKPSACDQVVRRALMTVGILVGVAILIEAMVLPLCAQPYPSKPIRFIVPFAPGGAQDILARTFAPKLADRLGQTVVVENRTGANGTIGCEIVAKAKPDGHTIVIGAPGPLVLSPGFDKKLSYDPIKDFAPIALVAYSPYVIVVRSSLPVHSLKEFIQYAKANPGKLTFGSAGMGNATHMAGELLKVLAKIDIVHVPYKGGGQALIGLMGNEIDMQITSTSSMLPYLAAGKIRALAVLKNGKERFHQLPDVPTSEEAGIADWEVGAWYGIVAPAKTPREIVSRLSEECIRILAMPETKEQMQKVGLDQLSGTPEQFSKFLTVEVARWAKVIKEANIRLD